jgi:hypothetical protein
MTYEEFLSEVVKQGIAAARRDYTRANQKALLKGSVAGFTACMGKSPVELLTLLDESHKKANQIRQEEEVDHDKYWEARGFALEVEWVCNCVSCLQYNEGRATLIPPTAGAMIFVSKIVGVKGK